MFTNNDLTKLTLCCTVLHEQPITVLYSSSFFKLLLCFILNSNHHAVKVQFRLKDSMSQCLGSGIHCCAFRMVQGETTAVKYIFCFAEICGHKLCIRVDGIR